MDAMPIGDFLRARRQVVSPEDVGLHSTPNRKVAGLRRDEVASLAGISPDYYLRLEQGRDTYPSDQVLKALAKALLLDDEATEFMHRLVRPSPVQEQFAKSGSSDMILTGLLASWSHAAAVVITSCQDVVSANPLALALSSDAFLVGTNLVESVFAEATRQFAPHWEQLAADTVAALRESSDARDPRLHELVGTLSTTDADFSRLWARHEVRAFTAGTNWFYVEPMGAVEFRRQNFAIPGYPGLILVTVFGDPGSPAAQALQLLGNRLRT